MNSDRSEILAVPTNIITGFLGVGKTSAILNLMKNKPSDERWAILVNEFGEIGIDGSLFQGQNRVGKVFLQEVPGGCMCCVAGLPMQIALNQLLKQAKPDRLLIEPTGLGHPKEVFEVLSSKHYQQVLSLQKTITLVDARKLSDSRYTEHETFIQQIAIADHIVGNKTDLYQPGDDEKLQKFVKRVGRKGVTVTLARQACFDFALLQGNSGYLVDANHHHHHHHSSKPLASSLPMPATGVIKATNEGEGFMSVGWRFASNKVFDRHSLITLLVNIEAERLKGVFITQDGVFGYNLTPDGMEEVELDDCNESRIEIIAQSVNDELEQQLLDCQI